ncbi:sister chromatid cohesion C-terminus-domain-containing protein [Thamnidium elegans]|nr:sister chromatid cohesion C-terminus-domain-containing protein [Thamnidium elegans]
MRLKSRALKTRENDEKVKQDTSSLEADSLDKTKRLKKRIIIEESSSEESDDSNDEDDVPLFQRKAVQNTLVKKGAPFKKIKISAEEQAVDKPKTVSTEKSFSKNSKTVSVEFKAPSNEFKVSSNNFKAPTNEFKAPTNEFKAPTNEFKAPTNEFKAPSNKFKALSSGFKVPSNDFKTPSNDFKVPMIAHVENSQNNLISSRLSHYMTMICEDLDRYDRDKIKQVDSLLTFRDQDDIPTLDITVMRKFTSLTTDTNRLLKSLDTVDMVKFGKIIKLMENTIIVSTDIDIIDYFVKDNEKNKECTLRLLNNIGDALDTCSMIFELLTTCKLDKKFLSRNLITNCLHFIKNQLDYTIYPLIDLNNLEDEAISLSSDARVFLRFISSLPKERKLISTFIPHIIRFFRRAFTLILSEDLDDDVLVIVAYISMAPFFHEYSEQHKSILISDQENDNAFNPYEQLKFCALDILKHIFSKYPKHRRWIFEEILTSLGTLTTMDEKRKFRLRNNQSISVISALFMQLVQCSASLSDLSSHKNWFRKWNIRFQKVSKSKDPDQMKLLDDKLVRRAATAWRLGAEAAANCASFFLEFLMSKCKSRKSDSYSLQEYRQILQYTLEDIMTVFNDPEWPVAELIMRVFSRILVSLLEGDHSDQYLKTLAIKWLGIITCKIKTGYNKLAGETKSYTPEWVSELNETLPVKVNMETPAASIALLDQCRKKMLDYALEERASTNVLQFYLCNWGFIESVLWKKANKGWEIEEKKSKSKKALVIPTTTTTEEDGKKTEEDEDLDGDSSMVEIVTAKTDIMEEDEVKWPKETALLLGETCKYYWMSCLGLEHNFPKLDRHYEFPEMSRSDYLLLAELLASRQTLYTSFNFLLSEILTCIEKDGVIYRTNALRAIGKISSEVPEIMDEARICSAVVQRVHDASPTVRDAAVEVVAKYLGRLSTVPIKLYEIVSGRIMDTSYIVRKRLVKLLRDLYFKFFDPEIKIDIASKLILRIGDNEIVISQLALKITQEILFQPFEDIEKEGNDYFGYSYANSPKERKRKINELTKVITGAVSKLDPSITAQNAALSQIIQKTINTVDEKSKNWYEKIFQWIVDSLFDRMISLDEEEKSEEFIHCLATVYSFTKSCPNLLRETQISMLQPYLCISSDEDWTKARYVLTIYRDVLPKMKYHDPAFTQSVERVLMQLLSKCPLDTISKGVSCLCVIIDRISYRYNILIKMLGSCINKLRQVRELISHGGDLVNGSFAGVLKMLMICGLLCQHFEFDKKREQEPEAMQALNLVYKGEINTLVFDLLQFFTGDIMDELKEEGITMRMTALQGLGYFFASYPTFMISKTSLVLMDKIFKEGTNELQTQLMCVFQEFLAAEEKRIDRREELSGGSVDFKDIDVDILLGNTEECAELGVNGSLMQRYLRRILKCALSKSDELRYAAFEVVSAIIHQGLAHPVLCMPVIVAAETSPDIILRTKAYYLHKYTHDKYGAVLYSRMSEYLSTSYDYQKLLFDDGHVQGYGKRGGDSKVDPVLGLTFSVLKDKKRPRFDFFSALIKPFALDLKSSSSDDIDINYLKYLAENTITLDLCTTEEVLYIVYYMDRTLMTVGADLLSYVSYLKKQGILKPVTDDETVDDQDELDHDFIVASKMSVALCILMYVKNLLVELYDIPDDEIREFNPNIKKKARDVTKDSEMDGLIDWHQLLYFKQGKLNRTTASDACFKFEYLIMSDTTAVIAEDTH